MTEHSIRLFIIDLHYVASLDRIDSLIPGHLDYLERGYADGVFLTSGRKAPRTGGIILATDVSRDALERRLVTDPFVSEGAAEVSITEVQPSRVSPDVETLLRRMVAV
jgi:uncharacterized protein YciI